MNWVRQRDVRLLFEPIGVGTLGLVRVWVIKAWGLVGVLSSELG